MKTVDELMALADVYAEQCNQSHESISDARAALLTALQEALPETWIDDGGWEFPIERPTQPVAQPLTDDQIDAGQCDGLEISPHLHIIGARLEGGV